MNTMLLISKSSYAYKLYLKISMVIASLFSLYFGLESSLKMLGIALVLDALTRIHATAIRKKMKFNPFTLQFWLVIKSKGLRLTLNKALMQYGIYFLLAYFIDYHILEQMTIINFQEKNYTLPVIVLWVCIGTEIWSIGENIEDAGGINIPKRSIHFLDEKYQKLFKKSKIKEDDSIITEND